MIEIIMKEKISADHLLYVSLKYTKTCDVIMNLLKRWVIMIDHCISGMLEQLKKKKKIKIIPAAPRQKVELIKENFKNQKEVLDAIVLYEFFKRIDESKAIKECEFRKDVGLKVIDNGSETKINLDKLKEYSVILERFISYIKQFLSAK